MKKLYWLISVFLILTSGNLYRSFARMDQIPAGTRPMGMGGAFLAVGGDGNTISWNPSAMPFVRHQYLGFAYHVPSEFLDIKESNLSYLSAITDRHAIGLDWFRTGFDDGEYRFAEDRFLLSYGCNPYKSLSFGIGLKYVSQNQVLDNADFFDANGLGVDIGAMISPLEQLRFGFVALDATDTWVSFEDGARDKLYDRTLRYGLSYHPVDFWSIALDYDTGPHLGTEYWYANTIAVRGGIYKNLETRDGIRYSFGGSLRYRVLQFDYAFNTHPVLPDTHRLGISIAFELTPSLIKIENIETRELFSTLYQRYNTEPIGEVVLRNKGKKPLPVTVNVFIPEYMESPTELVQDLVLLGQEGHELVYSPPVAIKPILSSDILGVDQNTQTQAEIAVTYEHMSRTRTVRKSDMITILPPGILPLGDSIAPIAALIDPYDEPVESFAREIISRYSAQPRMHLINKRISRAVQLYSALNALGLRYVPDPTYPYGSASIDSVKYPRDMIAVGGVRTGDCDDETSLYAALLESIGIRTRLVGFPGHVYVMFDTGIHKRNSAFLSMSKEQYLILRGSSNVWVPVEVTRFGNPEGSSFEAAWQDGLQEFREAEEADQLEICDVHEAWRMGYVPNHPPGDIPEIALPLIGDTDPLIVADVNSIQRQRYAYLNQLEQYVDSNPKDTEEANRLALLLVFWKRYDRAIQHLRAILDKEPGNVTALSNLGGIYTILGEFEQAQGLYQRAGELDKSDPGIQVNLGLVRKFAGDDDLGDKILIKAMQDAGGPGEALELIGVAASEETRGLADLMVANQIRTLFNSLAEEEYQTMRIERASEISTEDEKPYYLYWRQ